jgi:hypothetical protein
MPQSDLEDGTDKVLMQLCMLTEHIDKGHGGEGMKKGYNSEILRGIHFSC